MVRARRRSTIRIGASRVQTIPEKLFRKAAEEVDARKRAIASYAGSRSGEAEYRWAKGVHRGLSMLIAEFSRTFQEESPDLEAVARFFETPRFSKSALAEEALPSLADLCRRLAAWTRSSCEGSLNLAL